VLRDVKKLMREKAKKQARPKKQGRTR
jgi:hypothetical protein